MPWARRSRSGAAHNDFADPGTVTITFVRTVDGTTHEYAGQNLPDGAWFLNLVLDATLRGTWDVTVVLDPTGADDTCTDRVTIGSVTDPPNTVTVTPVESTDPPIAPLWQVLAAGAVALAGVAILGVRETVAPRGSATLPISCGGS